MTTATLSRGVARLPTTVAEAQELVEAHLDYQPYTGKCTNCGEVAPCRGRELAHAAFRSLGALPRRRNRHHRTTR